MKKSRYTKMRNISTPKNEKRSEKKNGMKHSARKTLGLQTFIVRIVLSLSHFVFEEFCVHLEGSAPATHHHTRQHAPRNTQTHRETHKAQRKGTECTTQARQDTKTPSKTRHTPREKKKRRNKTKNDGRERCACVYHRVMCVRVSVSTVLSVWLHVSVRCITGSFTSVRA